MVLGNVKAEPEFEQEKYVWLKSKLSLDLLAIDEEICEMPTLIQEAGELTAAAIEVREAAKDDLEKTIAQSAEALRNTPSPSGKARSETAISSQVYLGHEVDSAKKAYGNARLDAALWSSLMEALRRKDSAIRVVADLLNSGFLTSSSITNKRRKEIRNVQV